MTTFFTADTHFDHKNILQYCNRPFFSTNEMNQCLIENWNRVVQPEDTVYHLGDFTLGNFRHFSRWVSQLNGTIKIVPGSHDYVWMKGFQPDDRVQVIDPLVSIEFPEIRNGPNPQLIVLCHYSMQAWDRAFHGSWHLFGHSHGSLQGVGKSFDVGVDCTRFTPLSLEEVALKMAALPKTDRNPLCNRRRWW